MFWGIERSYSLQPVAKQIPEPQLTGKDDCCNHRDRAHPADALAPLAVAPNLDDRDDAQESEEGREVTDRERSIKPWRGPVTHLQRVAQEEQREDEQYGPGSRGGDDAPLAAAFPRPADEQDDQANDGHEQRYAYQAQVQERVLCEADPVQFHRGDEVQ